MRLPPPAAARFRAPTTGPRYDRLKRPLDLGLCLLLAPFVVPVMVIAWVAVRLTSAGPGLYSQTRVGRYGQTYRILKLRSMYHNCEAVSGAQWSTKGDPRVTPVGRLIRKLHVDEFPQIWNVLAGHMSLVGPRPERPEFVVPLAAAVPGYADRLRVRPGLTGLAQIQLPPDTDLESVRAKIVLDRHYVASGSVTLDLRILFGTAVYLLGVSYATVRRVALLPDPTRPTPPEPATPAAEDSTETVEMLTGEASAA